MMDDLEADSSDLELVKKEAELAVEMSVALRSVIARLLYPSETQRDRQDFYAHYQFYLTEIIDLARRVQRIAHSDRLFFRRLLCIHETFLDKKRLLTTHQGPFPYLNQFITLWESWKDQSDAAVVEALRHSLSANYIKGREEHLRALENWLSQGQEEYPDDLSLTSVSKIDPKDVKPISSFSHNVSWAALSLHKAFMSANDCHCKTHHELEARICLRSFRERISMRPWEFDMFLAYEEKWQEAHVSVSEKDDSDTHAKGTRVRFQLPLAQSTTGQRSSKIRKRISRLCADVRKVSVGNSKCLEMDVSMDQLWKLASQDCRYRIDQQLPPISLRQFISEHSDSLTMKTKGIIAILVSRTVLHFHGTPWIQRNWDSSKIFFYHKAQDNFTKSYIPVKPYMQTHLCDVACCPESLPINDAGEHDLADEEQNHSDLEIDPDDLGNHQCPLLIALAIILLELYLGKPYPFLLKACGMAISEEEDYNSGWDSAVSVFHRFSSEISEVSSFRGAIESCLRPPLWEDDEGRKLDSQALRQKIYEEIVVPLEMELTKGFSYIKIDKLDYEAERIGLDRWGEHIPDHGRGFPVDNAQNDETSPKYSDWKAQISSRMHRKRTQAVVHEHNSYKRIRVTGSSYLRGQFFDDITPPEGYTRTQLDAYADWKAEFRGVYDKFITKRVGSSPLGSPVKIAVLDTGTNLDHPLLEAYEDQIKKFHNWTGTGSSDDVTDHLGHGTHVAGLLLYYCPHAELYIAKVADKCEPKPEVVAKAIIDAVKSWGVDIISMSFGFPTRDIPGYLELEAAIDSAIAAKTLIFAAASNGGANCDRAYPARNEDVFCVHSTDAQGNGSSFNPTPGEYVSNFATIGEAVQSAWPENIHRSNEKPGLQQHRSGTSYATPIAATVAGFLLNYARLHLTKSQANLLKRRATMKTVLHALARKPRSGYHYLALSCHPDNLFGRQDENAIRTTIEEAICHSG